MKKNRRIITVNESRYVWWYGISPGLTIVTISPFEDKTSRVRVEFQDTEHDCDYIYCFTFPLTIELKKDEEQHYLKLIEPKMAAFLTEYLSQRELFKTRKQIILNGNRLLTDMGYEIIRIENGVDF